MRVQKAQDREFESVSEFGMAVKRGWEAHD